MHQLTAARVNNFRLSGSSYSTSDNLATRFQHLSGVAGLVHCSLYLLGGFTELDPAQLCSSGSSALGIGGGCTLLGDLWWEPRTTGLGRLNWNSGGSTLLWIPRTTEPGRLDWIGGGSTLLCQLLWIPRTTGLGRLEWLWSCCTPSGWSLIVPRTAQRGRLSWILGY